MLIGDQGTHFTLLNYALIFNYDHKVAEQGEDGKSIFLNSHYAAVSCAIRRFEEKSKGSRRVSKLMKAVGGILNVQT